MGSIKNVWLWLRLLLKIAGAELGIALFVAIQLMSLEVQKIFRVNTSNGVATCDTFGLFAKYSPDEIKNLFLLLFINTGNIQLNRPVLFSLVYPSNLTAIFIQENVFSGNLI